MEELGRNRRRVLWPRRRLTSVHHRTVTKEMLLPNSASRRSQGDERTHAFTFACIGPRVGCTLAATWAVALLCSAPEGLRASGRARADLQTRSASASPHRFAAPLSPRPTGQSESWNPGRHAREERNVTWSEFVSGEPAGSLQRHLSNR